MKKLNHVLNVTMLYLITSTSSCASSLKQPPALKERRLRIDLNSPEGFVYQTEECTGKLWWRKCKIVYEQTDFCRDLAKRKELDDIGFTLNTK